LALQLFKTADIIKSTKLSCDTETTTYLWPVFIIRSYFKIVLSNVLRR